MKFVSLPEERWTELLDAEKRLNKLLEDHPELKNGKKLTPTAKRYREEFKKFVDRVDQVLSSDDIKGVFQIAYVHGFKYTGPSLAQDIVDAKKLLK